MSFISSFQSSLERGDGLVFNVYNKPAKNDEGTLVLHHGIGSSAMTFALFCEQISKINPDLGLLLYDARSHGRTVFKDPEHINYDLSLDSLVNDLEYVVSQMVSSHEKLLLLGHSMGATVVSNAAAGVLKTQVKGLIVVDAVEGYANQQLRSMSSLLSTWPQSFASLDDAVTWHLTTGHLLRNAESARISVPACLKKEGDYYSWVLDLKTTKKWWDSWFTNLDRWFLSAPCARMLVLPGTIRLDTELTRAQMQGKFQMQIFNDSGHFIQEDIPRNLAECVSHFWSRNGHPIKVIPKFGQIRQ